MLLKYSQTQKRAKLSASGKPQRVTGMKLTSSINMGPRVHRKMMKNITNRKLNTTHHRAGIGLKRELKSSVTPVDPCDNSNDSGLGFDHHSDYPIQHRNRPSSRFPNREKTCCSEDASRFKKHRMDFKVESDEDANDYFSFYETVQQQKTQGIHNLPRCISSRRFEPDVQPPLTSQLSSYSSDGRVSLEIISEPESQHRARYQTEGSRGAVKDRTGTSFPIVRLNGYNKPTALQVFIGTDEGDVAPHMFYQACRVAGKNSTPSQETTIDRTVVIEMDIHPVNNMITVCDCVGILKERNVDVEHRFPEGSPPSKNSRKKSTSVRMVFRTTIRLPDGSYETLQATSDAIACTQPQGVPEVSLMSWTSSPVTGGVDLFIIGKNFVKDTKVVFYEGEDEKAWKVSVQPNKDFLHQSHLVCKVPAYVRTNISSPVQVKVVVESCGKCSESQPFAYTPIIGYLPSSPNNPPSPQGAPPSPLDTPPAVPEVALMEARSTSSNFQQFHPVMLWSSPFVNTQPPMDPTGLRRPDLPALPLPKCVCHKECIQMQLMHSALMQPAMETEQSQPVVKEESKELPVQQSKLLGAGIVAELSTTQQPSLATIRQFVSNQTSEHPLPSINVENYLSRLENPSSAAFPKQEPQTNQTALSVTSAPIDLSNQLVSSVPLQDAIKSEPSFGELISAAPCTDVTRGGKRKLDADDGVDIKIPCLTFPDQTTTDGILSATSSNGLLTPSMQEMIDSRNISSDLPQPLVDLVGSSLASTEATERLDDLVNSAAEKHMSSSSTSSSPASILSPMISPSKSPSLLSPTIQTSPSPLNLLPTPLEELRTCNMRMAQPQGTSSDILTSSMNVVGMSNGQPQGSSSDMLTSSMNVVGMSNGQPQGSSSDMLTSSINVVSMSNGQLVSSIEKSYTSTSSMANMLLQNLLPESKVVEETKDGHLSLMREIEINRIPSTMTTDPVVTSGYSVPVPVSDLLQSNVQQSSMTLIPLTIPNASDNILPVPLAKVPQPVSLLPMSTEQPVVPVLPLSTNQSESTVKRPEVANTLTGGIQELTQMSENDLLSYINPSCFDQV